MSTEELAGMKRCLLFLVHLGYIELKRLIMEGKLQQARDLTQALQNIPEFVFNREGNGFEALRAQIGAYQQKHGVGLYDYLWHLDMRFVPEHWADAPLP